MFTLKREVDDMLALIPDMFNEIGTTFLEPACGNGNFLVEILAKKISNVEGLSASRSEADVEFDLLRALSSIYAIDISEVNVEEAKHRLKAILEAAHAFLGLDRGATFDRAVTVILKTNVITSDALTRSREIVFVEYQPQSGNVFSRVQFHLESPDVDLFYVPPTAFPPVHYSEL